VFPLSANEDQDQDGCRDEGEYSNDQAAHSAELFGVLDTQPRDDQL
jgi:hypothetical protein